MARWFLRVMVVAVMMAGMMVTLAQESGLRIEIGETVEGAASTEIVEYAVALKANQAVSITLVSEEFDTYLELYNDTGVRYASNDDADDTNSRIDFTPTLDGMYMIRVRSFGAEYPEGAYTLSVEALELIDLLEGRRLEYDQPLRVDANNALSVGFKFKGSPGEVVDIFASGDISSMRLLLLKSDGTEIARDESSGMRNTPAILRFELPESGTYTVQVVDTVDRPMTGAVEVLLKHSALLMINEGPQLVTLGVDRHVDRVDLDGEAGRKYLITVTAPVEISGTLQIEAYDPGGTYADTRFSVQGTSQFSFVFQAARSGRSTVIFNTFAVNEVFELTVEAQALE